MLHTNRLPRTAGMAVALIVACTANFARCDDADLADRNSNAGAEDAVEIPLDQIWALDMPGARPLNEVLNVVPAGEWRQRAIDHNTAKLQRYLMARKPTDEALPGAVLYAPGRGAYTLALQYFRRSDSDIYRTIFTSQPATLLFFSHASAYQVQIESVERFSRQIEIKYRFVPQYTVEAKPQLALIPLGHLFAGKYDVKITQLPMADKFVEAGFDEVSPAQAARIVCRPFSFTVKEAPQPDPGARAGWREIPLSEIWGHGLPGTRDVKDMDIRSLPHGLPRLPPGCLGPLPTDNKGHAGPGFVVRGTGPTGLLALYQRLGRPAAAPTTFPEGEELSLAYYSHLFAERIELVRIERRDKEITVRYRRHMTGNSVNSNHFALIPLGKLPRGEYRVNMVQAPISPDGNIFPPSFNSDIERVVCQSFSFSVVQQTANGDR